MGLLGNKKKEKVLALFDIGSGSVGAGLVLLGRGDRPTLVYQTRVPIQFQEELNFERFVDLALGSVSQAADRLVKEGFQHLAFTKHGRRHVDRIGISFASPWYVSQIKTIEREYEKGQTVTREHIGQILTEASKQFERSAIAEYAEQSERHPELIDRRVMDIKLNGYSVTDPYGAQATTLSLSLFLSALSERFKERVATLIERAFHTTPISFDSFGLIAFSTFRDLFPNTSSFLWCDVTGEVTDVGLLEKGTPVRIGSFPLGTHNIVRTVGKKFTTTPSEARSLLTRYAAQELESGVELKMEETIAFAQDNWNKKIRTLFDSFGEVYALPSAVFMITEESMAPLYTSSMNTLHATNSIGASQGFQVTALDGAFFRSRIQTRKDVLPDPFLSLMALFYNKVDRDDI